MQIIFFGLLLATTSIFGSNEPFEWSDSGIKGPKYSVLLEQIQTHQNQYPDLVTVIDYGKSVKGRALRMMVVMRPNQELTERPALIMSGSTHGNEYLNLEDRLPAEFLKASRLRGSRVSDFLDQGGALVLIPILNPDGYEARVRENAHGVDLNRDWDVEPANFKGFKEVETKSLAQQLETLTRPPFNLRYRITVDYHCCIGALLYPWSYTSKPLPEDDKASHIAIGEMADKNLKIDHGTTGQILGYFPVGTTKDYYYIKYNALSFTFEGRYGQENKNLTGHLSWWEQMMDAVTYEKTKPIFTLAIGKKVPFIKIAE